MLTNEKDADENVRLVQMHLDHQVRKYWFKRETSLLHPIFSWPWTWKVWVWNVVEIGKYHIYAQGRQLTTLPTDSKPWQLSFSLASISPQMPPFCPHLKKVRASLQNLGKLTNKLPINKPQHHTRLVIHKPQINSFNRPSDACPATFESILAASLPNLVLL